MRLRDLDGSLRKYNPADGSHSPVDTVAEADGTFFQCPLCAKECEAGEEDGRKFFRGAHYVLCWFRGKVPDTLTPKGRWNPTGTGLDDLTFVGPEACSVLITGGCGWHGHVRSGDAA